MEIRLIGFGNDRPPCFGPADVMQVDVGASMSVQDMLGKAGFSDSTGLILMRDNTVVPESAWPSTLLDDADQVLIMNAIEGG